MNIGQRVWAVTSYTANGQLDPQGTREEGILMSVQPCFNPKYKSVSIKLDGRRWNSIYSLDSKGRLWDTQDFFSIAEHAWRETVKAWFG